jgi:hypothetical protein
MIKNEISVKPLNLTNRNHSYSKFQIHKQKGKRSTIHISLDTNLLQWINSEIEKSSFPSKSTLIERALYEFKSRENESRKNVCAAGFSQRLRR